MVIEERLARLERQNRQLKWVLIGLAGLMLAGCTMGMKAARSEPGATIRTDIIQAGRIEVIDANGQPVVTLASTQSGKGGVVFTSNDRGVLVAQMGAADDGRGVVWTYTPDGHLRDSRR
jgi:hypothetical protein